MKQIFELYRMVGKAFTPVELLDYENNKIVTRDLSPTNSLKIMFSNKPPFDKVNYYFLVPNDMKIVHTSDISLRDDCDTNGKYVYEVNEQTDNFMPVGKYADCIKQGLDERLKEAKQMRDVMAKLAGGDDIDLDNVMFKNIKSCDVCATIGDTKHQLVCTNEFIKPIYDVYIPTNQGGKVELKPFNYSNIIYKHHYNNAVSWIALPHGCNYIVDRSKNFDKEVVDVVLCDGSGKVVQSFSNLEELKNYDKLIDYAYTGLEDNFIDLLKAKISVEIEMAD